MHLDAEILHLVNTFRAGETDSERGPLFKDVALALESRMQDGGVTKSTIVACFGPPDRYDENLLVYFFDHQRPGNNSDEWYFHFNNGSLVNSGHNARGINNLTELHDGSTFPVDDA